jgi:chemotaxis methyl-accepting protein methylase
MANLTLSIDDELLQRAREAALRERTSVNALVREYLERYVDARRQRYEALDALDALATRTESASTAAWTREDVNVR